MRKIFLSALVLLGLLLLVACKGTAGPTGPAGAPGTAGPAGAPGAAGAPGKDAPLPLGTARQVNLSVAVSRPANGTHFVAGEAPTLTITIKDQAGKAFNRADDFTQLRLMGAGPQETVDTTTPVKLLKTSADRTQTIHHYVDLKVNTDVQVSDATLTYKLAAVSDEKPGTYIVSVWAVSKADSFQQVMSVAEFQIGTATVEKQIVEKEKCASCHLGADSGKFYFHHIDQVSPANPAGNFSLDQNAVRNCKTCHNNEGYSATLAADGKTRVPSPIVKKVHGVHYGEELSNPLNIDPKTGVFKLYTGVVFPANIKNCTSCHVDDRWKTQPSRLACGACHDAIDWATGKSVVKDSPDHLGGPQANDSACATCHSADNSLAPIAAKHKVEPSTGLHGNAMNKIDVSLTPPKNGKFYVADEKPVVTLVIRDDKGNPIDHTKVTSATFTTASLLVYGPRYLAQPVLTQTAADGISKLSASIANFTAARGTPASWTFAAGDTFKIGIDGNAPQVLTAPAGAQTPAQVAEWLKTNLKDVTVTSTATTVTIRSNALGAKSRIDIYNSPVTTTMGWKRPGLDLIEHGKVVGKTSGDSAEPRTIVASLSIPGNDLRSDPRAVRTTANITYPLDDVASLKPGTYMIYSYVNIVARLDVPNLVIPQAAKDIGFTRATGIGFKAFQVGTETPDKKVATNCSNCHSDTIWHLDEGPIHAAPFDTDYCLACHDYQRFGTGDLFQRVGGNSSAGWAGYGAKPIGPRVHGVHRAAYLDHPEWIYEGNPNMFNEIIFPQDIRNCTKCHSAETTGTWKTEPSRLACTSCHDSDSAIAHTDLMTQNPNPADPYDPQRVETCKTCHGAGRDFSPDKAHNISNPYKPPYPRE
ncbi:MAG: cytochrome c3 family protein [Chloroflexi bacterium]|nr:cytochrome c3 family protein [Chloroflexota bacterium]